MASHMTLELLSFLLLLAAPVSGLAPSSSRHATSSCRHQSPSPRASWPQLSAKARDEPADGAGAPAFESQTGESYARASPDTRGAPATPRTRREVVGFGFVGGLGALGMLAPPVAAFENAIPDYAK